MAPKAMQAGGLSKSTKNAHANQIAIFNEFLEYIRSEDAELSARWGVEWEKVPEAELSQAHIWAHLATFLVEVYVIKKGSKNEGEHPDIGTAHGYWGGLIDQARTRTSSSESLAVKVRVCLACLRAYLSKRAQLLRTLLPFCTCIDADFLFECTRAPCFLAAAILRRLLG
jgi:hypothetical protein